MYSKKISFFIFLVFTELFVKIKAGDENDMPGSSKSEKISAHVKSIAQLVNEAHSNLHYVNEHWNEILLLEQHKIIRLRIDLEGTLKQIRPDINNINFITTEEILQNEKILLPHLKALDNCLKTVVKNYKESYAQKRPYWLVRKQVVQEINLLSHTSAKLRQMLKNLSQHWIELPSLIQKDILQRLQWLDEVITETDLRMPRKFPTREQLIKNRNGIMPIVEGLHRFLIDVETIFLQEQSTQEKTEQQKQEKQIGQGLQAKLGEQSEQRQQTKQGGQSITSGSEGKKGSVRQTIQEIQQGLGELPRQEWQKEQTSLVGQPEQTRQVGPAGTFGLEAQKQGHVYQIDQSSTAGMGGQNVQQRYQTGLSRIGGQYLQQGHQAGSSGICGQYGQQGYQTGPFEMGGQYGQQGYQAGPSGISEHYVQQGYPAALSGMGGHLQQGYQTEQYGQQGYQTGQYGQQGYQTGQYGQQGYQTGQYGQQVYQAGPSGMSGQYVQQTYSVGPTGMGGHQVHQGFQSGPAGMGGQFIQQGYPADPSGIGGQRKHGWQAGQKPK